MKNKFWILFLLFLTACQSSTVEEEKDIIYTSFYPILQLTEDIGEDTIETKVFMPTHQDPHLWEPSAKNIKDLEEAKILIVNGAGIEPWLPTIKKTLPDLEILDLSETADLLYFKSNASLGDFQFLALEDFSKETYELTFGHTHEEALRIGFFKKDQDYTEDEIIQKGLEIMSSAEEVITPGESISVEDQKLYEIELDHHVESISFTIPEAGEWYFYSDYAPSELLELDLLDSNFEKIDWNILREESTKGEELQSADPHSWLSLKNLSLYAEEISSLLTEYYPENKELYEKNRDDIVERASKLDEEYHEKFHELDHPTFVVSNPAFSYIARDYHLIEYPLEGISSLEFPSLHVLKETIETMKEEEIHTLFYEHGMPTQTVDVLADEIDGEVRPLISGEYLTKKIEDENFDFLDIMEFNLKNLYEGLR